jgi:hypothetical protein
MNSWGFILDVANRKTLSYVKKEIVLFLNKIPLDEKAYLFRVNNEKVPLLKSETTAAVVGYIGEVFILGDAIQHTTYVLASDLNGLYYDRHVIIITDRYSEQKRHRCITAFQANERDSLDTDYLVYEINCESSLQDICSKVKVLKNVLDFKLGE